MVQLMPLPLTVSCFTEIQIGFTFLVPAHLVSPWKRAVKRVCVCVLCVWQVISMSFCAPPRAKFHSPISLTPSMLARLCSQSHPPPLKIQHPPVPQQTVLAWASSPILATVVCCKSCVIGLADSWAPLRKWACLEYSTSWNSWQFWFARGQRLTFCHLVAFTKK